MPATKALSAAPPSALTIWTDGLSLFTELPGPDRSPVIIRYPLTAAGLSSALGLILRHRPDGLDRTYQPPAPSPTPTFPGTSTQRDNAAAVLRRIGFLR